ncbi:flagellar motor protein MotB [Paenibacillus sp. y28]|uniref:flagellar motor protein MotB n=1 Tax=Paenibacillus sp. y28 TaxID=3129110 RepID=UPI003016F8CE
MARRRRTTDHGPNHERWLITYADLITLLLIFFVILYSVSKIDANQYDSLAQSLQFQFNKNDSLLEAGSGLNGSMNPSPKTDQEAADKERAEQEAREAQEQKLQDALKIINDYISENHLEAEVSVRDTEKGISITLKDLFLFDLGKADLKPAASPILEQLAALVPKLDSKISIEGHTDNLPLATGALYKDNWGLSGARSLSVLRYFVETAKLDSSQFIFTGYADTRPVAPNDTEENRTKNRRVEIVVLRSSP